MNPNNANRPVFDASAVLALMQGEPGADRLKALQRDAIVNAVNAAEVLAKLAAKEVNVYAVQAVSAGNGRFGALIQVDQAAVKKAARALA